MDMQSYRDSQEQERMRLEFVTRRDGLAAACDFARRTLAIYQNALRYRNPGTLRRHFSFYEPYIARYVGSITELKRFLKDGEA